MGIYLALLLAFGALAAVLLYFFGPKGAPDEARPASPASPSPKGEREGLIHVVAKTDPGLKRKQNEDSFLVVEEQALFVVADGMGRHAAGEVASKLAVDTMEAHFLKGVAPAPAPAELPAEARRLRDATLAANKAVFKLSGEEDRYQGMGTTVVALHFSPDHERAIIASAGDSRCYRLRGGELKQLTTDHTLGAVGIVGNNAALLSRAVGIEENLEVDVLIDAPAVGDLYLLCSDGLSRMATDEAMTQILRAAHPLEDRARQLVEVANQAGGRDNVTLILVQVASRKSA